MLSQFTVHYITCEIEFKKIIAIWILQDPIKVIIWSGSCQLNYWWFFPGNCEKRKNKSKWWIIWCHVALTVFIQGHEVIPLNSWRKYFVSSYTSSFIYSSRKSYIHYNLLSLQKQKYWHAFTRDQFNLLFYGPDRPVFCQKEKKQHGFSDWLFIIHLFFIDVERKILLFDDRELQIKRWPDINNEYNEYLF